MPYFKNTMIMRSPKQQRGLSGWTDTVGDILSGAVSFYGSQQKAQGAAEALAAQQAAAAQPISTGPSTTTLVVGGVAVAGLAYLLLRKKS